MAKKQTPAEQVAEQPAEQVAEQPAEQVAEQPAEQVAEQPAEQVAEQPAEQAAEQPAEQAAEQPAAAQVEYLNTDPVWNLRNPLSGQVFKVREWTPAEPDSFLEAQVSYGHLKRREV